MVRNAIQRPITHKKGTRNQIHTFVVDRMTWLEWMRSLKCDIEVCGETFVSCVVSRYKAIW